MNGLPRRLLILLAAFSLPALLSHDVARSQDVANADQLPVEVMAVLELPAYVTNPILIRTEKGYRLNFQISNSTDDRILGFTYLLLVFDSAGKLRTLGSRGLALELDGYATKDLTLRVPGKLEIGSSHRTMLIIQQVIGRESVWEVLNAQAMVEAHVRGDHVAPEVKQVLDQVDSPPRLRVIY
ncbi:MAG: hypothetical protein ND895_01395 [Pyrinomonadaceae bacterium]|nr:hypothetical protein [Pyrinomonadaceae bacterium]